MEHPISVTYPVIGAALKEFKRTHPSVRIVSHAHWTTFYYGNDEIASMCSSPYPGPEYGSFYKLEAKYFDGMVVDVQYHRELNGTEVHELNARLRALAYNDKYEEMTLISEIENGYRQLLQQQPRPTSVGPNTMTIFWTVPFTIRK